MDLSSADQLWKGAAGLAAVAGSLWLVAAKPVFSIAIERLDKGPTRDFLLESKIASALKKKFQAPPVRSGGVGESLFGPMLLLADYSDTEGPYMLLLHCFLLHARTSSGGV